MKKSTLNLLRGCCLAIFCILFLLIAFYRFPDRDLMFVVETEVGNYELEMTSTYIKDSDSIQIELPVTNAVMIKKIEIYGSLRSISLKSVSYSDFAALIEYIPNGEMVWSEEGLNIQCTGIVKMVLNENGADFLQKLSKSFLLERFCLLEILLIVCILLFIMITVLDEKCVSLAHDNHGPIHEFQRFWKDIRNYGNYIIYAAKTDLKAEVANSYLNRLWWLLEPLFNMLVYVIVFGGMMGKSIDNYATFVFSALLMWNFFSKTINYSVKLVRNNKDIVTKVYVPKFVLLISNMFLNMFKLLFSLIVLVAMLFIFQVQIGLEIFMVLPAYLVLILVAFGVGMIFLHYGVYVDDLSYAVGILLNMLMFLSGIFYDAMASLQEPLNTIILCLNPVAMTVDAMRSALLYREMVNIPLLVIWFVIAVQLCCIGVHIVYKNENAYVKVV